MTTYYNFQPLPNSPFSFTPTLDGVQYTVQIRWNVFGQRWYMFIYTLQQVLVLSRAVAGSPDDYDIPLTFGYFTSTIVFRQSTQNYEVSP
jgi:hypothetical protein